jgi:predicted TIM-barrel fold metal-dependent hydrolase
MKIDVFTHVLPARYMSALKGKLGASFYLSRMLETIPELGDIEMRLRNMDEAGVDKQVITLSSPPIESVISDPKVAAELTKVANDGIAEMAARSPNRLLPVGSMAMNNIDACLLETERCLDQLGMKGMLMYSSACGRAIDAPEFFPLYKLMVDRDLPIWLHPARGANQPDYVDEQVSKYEIWQIFGWPFETTAAMTRLIFGGVLDHYPTLKIIAHHAGAMVPFFAKRIEYCYNTFNKLGGSEALSRIQGPPLEYYRLFYTDTAVMGSVAAMSTAYGFYGADKLLFGTDTPFDGNGGKDFTRETLFSVEALVIPPHEKEMIYSGNLRRLLNL